MKLERTNKKSPGRDEGPGQITRLQSCGCSQKRTQTYRKGRGCSWWGVDAHGGYRPRAARPETSLALHSGAVDLNVYVPIKSLQACPTLWSLMDCSPSGSSVRGILQARILGCHFLLQEIFLTQRSNLHLLGLLPWHADYLPLAASGKPVDPTSLGHI